MTEVEEDTRRLIQATSPQEPCGGKVRDRWVSLVAGIFLMLNSGAVFTWGSIGLAVKTKLAATEEQTQLISVAGNVGLWTNVIGGLLLEKLGPRVTLLLGGALACLGFSSMWIILQKELSPFLAAAAWFAVGHGSGWIYISALFANLSNFTTAERAFVVGIMACFFGTSSTVLVAILDGCTGGHIAHDACHGGFMGDSVEVYMGFLAACTPIIVILGALLTSQAKPVHEGISERTKMRFYGIMALTVVLTLFICCANMYALMVDTFVKTWSNYVLAGILAVFFLVSALGEDKEAAVEQVAGSSARPVAAPTADLSPGSAIGTVYFWMLWLVFGITVGGDISTLNLLSAIVHSRRQPASMAHAGLIVAMGCDTSSRLFSGLAVARGFSITRLLMVGPVLMVVMQLLLLWDAGAGVYFAACAILGLSDGIMWSLGPLLVSRAFGLASGGRIFGLIVLAAAVFTLLVLLGVEPAVFNSHAQKSTGECDGDACFLLTHLSVAAVGIVGVAASLYLHVKPFDFPGNT